MSQSFNDKFLIAGASSGDEQAFGKLYDKYIDEIYKFIVMRVRSSDEAQDLTSEVFLKTWEYISTGEEKQIDNIRALLYRIARNIVIDHYRQSGRELSPLDEELFDKIPDKSLDLERDAQIKDDIREALSMVDELSEDYRELVLMRYVQDLKVKEIAQILDKSSGAVRVSLHRAIKQLKNILKGKDL